MSSVIVAVILIFILIIICVILISINNKTKHQTALALVERFNKIGKDNNFSFSEKEIIGDFIIGLDGSKQKLLVIKKVSDNYKSFAVDLKDVRNSVKRNIYKMVNTGTAKRERYERQLDKIILELNDVNKNEPLEISFYESLTNGLMEIPDLERKADDWQTIITKVIENKVSINHAMH